MQGTKINFSVIGDRSERAIGKEESACVRACKKGGGGEGERGRQREKWHFGSVRGVVRLPFGACATFLCNWTSPLLHSKKRCICFTKSQKPPLKGVHRQRQQTRRQA